MRPEVYHQFILWKRLRNQRRNSYPLMSCDAKFFPETLTDATGLLRSSSSWDALNGVHQSSDSSLHSLFLVAPEHTASTRTRQKKTSPVSSVGS